MSRLKPSITTYFLILGPNLYQSKWTCLASASNARGFLEPLVRMRSVHARKDWLVQIDNRKITV